MFSTDNFVARGRLSSGGGGAVHGFSPRSHEQPSQANMSSKLNGELVTKAVDEILAFSSGETYKKGDTEVVGKKRKFTESIELQVCLLHGVSLKQGASRLQQTILLGPGKSASRQAIPVTLGRSGSMSGLSLIWSRDAGVNVAVNMALSRLSRNVQQLAFSLPLLFQGVCMMLSNHSARTFYPGSGNTL